MTMSAMAMSDASTGEQFEITYGRARAVVTEVGANLRAFEVDGVPYVETYPADGPPPLGAGAVLLPWPNRTADGRWVLDGEPQQLELTEPDRGNAIHGLVRHARWQLVDKGGSWLTLRTEIDVRPGWPVPLRTTVNYLLDAAGLTVTHEVHNVGERSVPFGLGVHPYPRAGNTATDECVLRLAASTVLPLDSQRLVPTGPASEVAGTEYDFRGGRPLRGVWLNTPFGGCEPAADGRVHHTLAGQDDAVELWADPDFRWVQVFTPETFSGSGRAVAIEPMTAPPDALNSGTDLIRLSPGESWSGSWGLIPKRPVVG
jgi:aldose 1-epimerase